MQKTETNTRQPTSMPLPSGDHGNERVAIDANTPAAEPAVISCDE